MENQLVWWMQAVSPFSLDELEIASHLAKGILSIPALLVHGTTDAIVPYTEGVSNYDSLYHSRHPHTNNTPPIDGPTHHNDSHIPWTRSQERAGHLSTSAQQRRLVERDGPVMDVDARSRAIDRGKRVLSMTRAQLQRALVDVEGARVNRRRGVDLDGSHGIERGGVEVRGRGADKWQRAQRARASIGIENLRVDRKRDGDVQRIGYHGNDNKGVREGEVIPRSMGHTINRRRNELKGTHAHDRARIRREDSRSAEVGLKGSKQLRLLFWTHVYGHVRAYLDSEYQITLVRFMEAFV
ncbi:hypothetical protein SARC_10730 [Sphaeroforma arctica JP610]|uniref:Uncharacterized protein n=1 Tax=Sphaeroforma arctica JP610 TaxID=667725 RepID=A0A0L0FJX2_9EUKA|nr:hypothetical protein SARC_10730 [Sphaeroforma arctica JP610]KNC76786.1 hypothetical protein SARC_10730 [Sphaeroforma arctica JP610]|eukprot:XP_014150688.1 hypothetical protein SARC_10730 [Sphaeroforma arctica JP610]